MAKSYNSKLTAAQKQERKGLKAAHKANNGLIFTYPNLGVVIVAEAYGFHGGGGTSFAVATQSEKERKFRRKVGEFYALEKISSGEAEFVNVDFRDDAALNHWAYTRALRSSRIVVNAD